MSGGWFNRGFGDVPEKPPTGSSGDGPDRLWMKAGEERKLLFLDEEPFCFYEHQLKIDGDWRNWFTCLQGIHPSCPLCTAGDKRYFVGALSVVDMTGWTDRDGNHRDVGKRLLYMAKIDSMLKLKKQKERRGGLVGAIYSSFRTGAKAASIGDDIDFLEKLGSLQEAASRFNTPPENLVPFRYEELFAPRSPVDLEPLTVWVKKQGGGGQDQTFNRPGQGGGGGQGQSGGQGDGYQRGQGGSQGGSQGSGGQGGGSEPIPY